MNTKREAQIILYVGMAVLSGFIGAALGGIITQALTENGHLSVGAVTIVGTIFSSAVTILCLTRFPIAKCTRLVVIMALAGGIGAMVYAQNLAFALLLNLLVTVLLVSSGFLSSGTCYILGKLLD